MHRAFALGDAAAAPAVHADRVHLVDIGHGAVLIGEVADGVDRRDVAVHRIDALEDDELRPLAGRCQELLEMGEVVVAEDALVAAGLAHALDHRVVVLGVRQDDAARDQAGDGRDAGLVRDVARGEDEGRVLAVQVGELGLELDHRMVVARDVARAAGAGADAHRGLGHGAHHGEVLAHAEIIVRAPHRDLARPVGRMPDRRREAPGDALEIGEDAVAALGLEALDGAFEEALVIHGRGRGLGEARL